MTKSSVINAIEQKVELLISENQRLRDDLAGAGKAAEKLRKENWDMSRKLTELEHKVSVLQTKEAISGTDDKQARARINRLMREVDKCIALLNR